MVLLSTTALFVGTGLSIGAPTVDEPTPAPLQRTLAGFVVLAQDAEELVGEEPERMQARFIVRIGTDELNLEGRLPLEGARRVFLDEEIVLDEASAVDLLHSITASLDADWEGLVPEFGEHEFGSGDERGIKGVMMFSADGEPVEGVFAQHWDGDPPAGLSTHLSLDLTDEMRAHLEQVLESGQLPEGAHEYRQIFVMRTKRWSSDS